MKRYAGLIIGLVVYTPIGTFLLVKGHFVSGMLLGILSGIAAALYDTR
jgi:hypothetical protein